nr:T9SS type A sorting domain-containing protein [Winogradskyella sp. DF17]
MNGIDGTQAFNIITTAGVANEYNGILNLEEEQALTDITIYPNPASDTIYLEGLQGAISSIEIFSITGQLVKQIEKDFVTINVKPLETGVYFLKINSKDKQRILKFIKE